LSPSSINGDGVQARFASCASTCLGCPTGEVVAAGAALLLTPLVVGVKLKPVNPELGLSFFVAKIDSPEVLLGAGASLFGGGLKPENALDTGLGAKLKLELEL
jgi:hypothetical protein